MTDLYISLNICIASHHALLYSTVCIHSFIVHYALCIIVLFHTNIEHSRDASNMSDSTSLTTIISLAASPTFAKTGSRTNLNPWHNLDLIPTANIMGMLMLMVLTLMTTMMMRIMRMMIMRMNFNDWFNDRRRSFSDDGGSIN